MTSKVFNGSEKLPPLLGSKGSPRDFGLGSRPTSQEKRTFKEKLHEAIIQAEDAEMAALREAQKQDRKSLAISMLVEGRPHAFVDFFSLTHSAELAASTGGDIHGELPQESLLLLKTQLVKADAARKERNVEEVYGAYKHLAKYFAQLGRLRTAEFFFKQCLYISREAGWLPGELEANLALGVVYEELRDTTAAIQCHERRLELASEHGLQAEMETAYQSLTSVYFGQAEGREAGGDVDGAIDAYNKCLNASNRAGDMHTQAKANYRMGMLYHRMQKWQDALYFLRHFIMLCNSGEAQNTDKAVEGVAHTTFADCLEQIGDEQAAISSLENYLTTMGRGADQSGPAIACCSLGNLFYARRDFDRAVTFFEKFFEIARGLPDRRVLEAARYNLGIARGAVMMKAYMGMVDTDLPRLIAWKNARIPFADRQDGAGPSQQ